MGKEKRPNDRYSTAEVARRVGIHRDTLLRWLRKGEIPEPRRDKRGWRVFYKQDVDRILAITERETVYQTVPMAISDEALNRLEAIDWSFSDAKTKYLTHGLHPYPAKFIPQIPNALIQELSHVGDTVMDMFCGSGTTLVEALLLKRHAVGIDANPLACLVSKAKIAAIGPNGEEELRTLADKASKWAETLCLESRGSLFGSEPFVSKASRPDADALQFWFDPYVIEELAEIMTWCRDLTSEPARLIALATFSSIIVAVSKQDSDTRYVRREKNMPHGEVFRRFSRSLRTATDSASELTNLIEPRFRGEVIHANVLEAPHVDPVDLVVCSPPYPNAYSYHLYHMTRMLWLGMDQPKFKEEEIGSHRKYSRKGPNGANSDTFREEMDTLFGWLMDALRKGHYACFVVGDSTIRGERIDNATLLSEAAGQHGFVECARLDRKLQATKKAFNPKIGKIKTERILILRNSG